MRLARGGIGKLRVFNAFPGLLNARPAQHPRLRETGLRLQFGLWQNTHMSCSNRLTLAVLLFALFMLDSCKELVQDTQSLLVPEFKRSELFGLVAGFGTTFAAMPDLIAMLRRRSSAGMNPRMAAITGVFQVLWVYYGLLIVSRPVVLWNVIAVLVNSFSVGAYFYFVRKEKNQT